MKYAAAVAVLSVALSFSQAMACTSRMIDDASGNRILFDNGEVVVLSVSVQGWKSGDVIQVCKTLSGGLTYRNVSR